MKTRFIAMYLSGNMPGFYREGYDKLYLIEIIKLEKLNVFDLFKIINADDFYFLALNKVRRAGGEGYNRVVNKLNIPEQVLKSIPMGFTGFADEG